MGPAAGSTPRQHVQHLPGLLSSIAGWEAVEAHTAGHTTGQLRPLTTVHRSSCGCARPECQLLCRPYRLPCAHARGDAFGPLSLHAQLPMSPVRRRLWCQDACVGCSRAEQGSAGQYSIVRSALLNVQCSPGRKPARTLFFLVEGWGNSMWQLWQQQCAYIFCSLGNSCQKAQCVNAPQGNCFIIHVHAI